MLDRLADDLWAIARPFKAAMGFTIASRMTVVRLEGGDLLLHSPVPLDPPLREALQAIGPVRHLVAPNRMHHLFCPMYKAAYPEARLWGAPGVAAKQPALAFDGELGDDPPAAWAAELGQALVRGIPTLNEVAFHHRRSGTLILTDLLANGSGADPFALRLWLRLNGAYGRLATPLEVRFLCRDKAAARQDVRRILGWGATRVVMGHGAIVERDAGAALRRAVAWLTEG